jgi:hypothetical protein
VRQYTETRKGEKERGEKQNRPEVLVVKSLYTHIYTCYRRYWACRGTKFSQLEVIDNYASSPVLVQPMRSKSKLESNARIG